MKRGKRFLSLLTALSMISSGLTVFAENESVPYNTGEILSEECEAERIAANEERERERAEREEYEAQRRQEQEDKMNDGYSVMGMTHAEAAIRQAALDRHLGNITAEPLTFSVFSDSEYSEVVYIESVDDLLTIDGHKGGYYELENDIDISGMEWKPIELYDATINGDGHTINGMTITSAPTEELGSGIYCALFAGKGNYIFELKLNNSRISFETEADGNCFISPLGDSYVKNCEISADIDVEIKGTTVWINVFGITSGSGSSYTGDIYAKSEAEIETEIYVSGLRNCVNCSYTGDITATVLSDNEYYYCHAYGIYGDHSTVSDCVVEGNITAENGYAHGICADYSTVSDNVIEGNITATSDNYCYAYGIDGYEGTVSDNVIEGNITATSDNYCYAYGIDGDYSTVSDCVVEGNITAENGDAYGISGGKVSGNIIEGNITATSDNDCYAYGIYGYEGTVSDNVIEGNITATSDNYCYVYGIRVYSSTVSGNVIEGNITAENGYVYGIYGGTVSGNVIEGDITAENGSANGIYGGAVSGCAIYGNVTANNGDARGILRGVNCYISGTIKETHDDHTLTVTAGAPYMGCFKCSCGANTTSRYDLSDKVHCYWYDSYGYARPRYYYTSNELYYSDDTETPSLPEGTGATVPPDMPDPTMVPVPTQRGTYSIQIVDKESGLPVEDAELDLDGVMYTTDENGMAVIDQGIRIGGLSVSVGGTILFTEVNWTARQGAVNVIEVNGLNLDADDFNFGNSAGTVIKGPELGIAGKKFPLFEQPMSFEFDFFDGLAIAYDKDKKEYQVLFGVGYDDESIKENDAQSPLWKKQFEEVSDFYHEFTQGEFSDDFVKRYNSTPMAKNKKAGRLGVSGDVSVSGFMRVWPENGELTVEGGLMIVLSGEVGSTYPLPACPLVYAAFSISGEIGSTLSVEFVEATSLDPKVDVKGTIEAALTPQIGIGAGVKGMLGVELGLNGTLEAGFEFPMERLEDSLTVSLSGGYYAVYYCLLKEFRQSDNFAKLQLYPYLDILELAEVNEDDLVPVPRDYLNNISVAEYGDGVYKTGLYPYSGVKTACLSDGRIIMVWLDDDAERADADRTALYYSIYENGTWSGAAQIDNDGTADFDFDLSAEGDSVAIVWQNACRALSDSESIDQTAEAVELSYSVFDGSAWSAKEQVTSGNTSYEYNPHIYYTGYETYIMWSTNSGDSAMPDDSVTESIYVMDYPGTAEMKYTDLTPGSLSDIGRNGKAAVITESENGMKLIIDGSEVYSCDTELGGLDYADDSFVFTADGSLKQADSYGNIDNICDNIGVNTRYITNGSGRAAVFEVQNGYTSELYARFYENGEWTAAVPVTNFDKKIRSWSAVMNDSGDISVTAVLASIEQNGTELNETVSLAYAGAQAIEDISADGMYADDTIAPGKRAEFTINVSNRSKTDIEALNVTLTGEKSGEIYNESVSEHIPAGESGEITVRAMLPDDFTRQSITAVISSDIPETDYENNAVSEIFGAADLNVSLMGSQISERGYARVIVRNAGCETAGSVTLRLVSGETVISELQAGDIGAGEQLEFKIDIDDEFRDISGGAVTFKAEVSSAADEQFDYNNSDTYTLGEKGRVIVSMTESSVGLAPGESYLPEIKTYPEEKIALYPVSSDETVAKVNADGEITAVKEGTAEITYMSPDAIMSAKFTVYVREKGTAEIVSSVYTDQSDDQQVYGNLEITVNTAECLAEGESVQMITAAYDEKGALICFDEQTVTASEANSVNISVYDKRPETVKVMLWDSISRQKPASYAAEIQIE